MADGYPVRVGVNAIVVENDRLLAVEFEDDTGHHYNLPGGGVETGESLPDALRREVREETAATVDVGDLAFVHEYEPAAHDHAYGSVHKLTCVFHGELRGEPALSDDPDPNQVGIEWLSLRTIEDEPLLPDLGGRWRAIARGTVPATYVDRT